MDMLLICCLQELWLALEQTPTWVKYLLAMKLVPEIYALLLYIYTVIPVLLLTVVGVRPFRISKKIMKVLLFPSLIIN